MNVVDWKVRINNEIVGQVLSCFGNRESTKIVSKTIDGSITVQTIGEPVSFVELVLLCTVEEKEKFVRYEPDGSIVSVRYRDKQYYGYFDGSVNWSTVIPGEWYNASGKLLITEEMTV